MKLSVHLVCYTQHHLCAIAAAAAAASTISRAITQTGSCKAPFSCVHLHNVPIPSPSSGQCLIRVNASSVNP